MKGAHLRAKVGRPGGEEELGRLRAVAGGRDWAGGAPGAACCWAGRAGPRGQGEAERCAALERHGTDLLVLPCEIPWRRLLPATQGDGEAPVGEADELGLPAAGSRETRCRREAAGGPGSGRDRKSVV